MCGVAEHVHHGHCRCRSHTFDGAVAEHAHRDDGVVPRHDASHIFHRFTHVEAHFLAAGVHRVTTQLNDRHLHALSRAVRWLLEHQGHAQAVERFPQRRNGALRQIEHVLHPGHP